MRELLGEDEVSDDDKGADGGWREGGDGGVKMKSPVVLEEGSLYLLLPS